MQHGQPEVHAKDINNEMEKFLRTSFFDRIKKLT